MAANSLLEPARLRWNLAMAEREFNVAKDTLRRRLGDSHEEPGPDGRYTTKQLTSALFGDLYGAKLRTQNEQAEKLRIENEISRAEVLSRSEAFESICCDRRRVCKSGDVGPGIKSSGEGGPAERFVELAVSIRGCRVASKSAPAQ